jgi:hypothetical protein
MNPDTGYIAADDYFVETHDAGGSWQVCDGYFMYFMNSIHSPDRNTVYSVSSWGAGPGFSALYKLDFTTGINKAENRDKKLSLYPNPVNDIIYIKGLNNSGMNCQIGIYNQLGQMVLSQVFDNYSINVSNLKPGAYIIVLRTGDWIFREKILIHR